MTPELQDDVGTVGYVEFMGPDDVNVNDEIVSIEASKTVLDAISTCVKLSNVIRKLKMSQLF